MVPVLSVTHPITVCLIDRRQVSPSLFLYFPLLFLEKNILEAPNPQMFPRYWLCLTHGDLDNICSEILFWKSKMLHETQGAEVFSHWPFKTLPFLPPLKAEGRRWPSQSPSSYKNHSLPEAGERGSVHLPSCSAWSQRLSGVAVHRSSLWAHQLASFTFSVPLLGHLTSRPSLATITHRPEGVCIFCILCHTCTKRIKTLGLDLVYSYKPMSAKKKKDIIQCTLFLRL